MPLPHLLPNKLIKRVLPLVTGPHKIRAEVNPFNVSHADFFGAVGLGNASFIRMKEVVCRLCVCFSERDSLKHTIGFFPIGRCFLVVRKQETGSIKSGSILVRYACIELAGRCYYSRNAANYFICNLATMSSVECLREFVNERLNAAAAEELFGV